MFWNFWIWIKLAVRVFKINRAKADIFVLYFCRSRSQCCLVGLRYSSSDNCFNGWLLNLARVVWIGLFNCYWNWWKKVVCAVFKFHDMTFRYKLVYLIFYPLFEMDWNHCLDLTHYSFDFSRPLIKLGHILLFSRVVGNSFSVAKIYYFVSGFVVIQFSEIGLFQF